MSDVFRRWQQPGGGGHRGVGVMNFTSLHSTVYTVEPPISGHAETKAACPES